MQDMPTTTNLDMFYQKGHFFSKLVLTSLFFYILYLKRTRMPTVSCHAVRYRRLLLEIGVGGDVCVKLFKTIVSVSVNNYL